MPSVFNDFCISSYLTFRHVVDENQPWKLGLYPKTRRLSIEKKTSVKDSGDVLSFLENKMSAIDQNPVGILLSGGIDSGILARMMPKGATAYTIQCQAEGAIDERSMAGLYVDACGLKHKIINVSWQDYLDSLEPLIKNRCAPLHPMEPALYKAVCQAKQDGIKHLVTGYGADGLFAGQDKLWSKDWALEEFIKRYTFLDPGLVIKKPISMRHIYAKYLKNDKIDLAKFMNVVFSNDTVESILNVFSLANSNIITPYEELSLAVPLDINRIRNGESKYIIREVFRELYPDLEIPEKLPFARPLTQWLKNWKKPKRPEFLDNIEIDNFTGEQKWLIFCLERFMNLME